MNEPGAEEQIADVVDFAEAEIEEPPQLEPTFHKRSEKLSAAFEWVEKDYAAVLKSTKHKLV